MKTKEIIFAGMLSACMTFLWSSCDDYLDINANPNYVTDATLPTLLPSIGAGTMTYLGYNGALLGEMWTQVVTQGNTTNQYNTLIQYNVTKTSYTQFWSGPYSIVLPDIRIALKKAEEQKAWNYWLICKVLEAYNWHMLTDWYGDIPFVEALNQEYPNPKYDDSKTVVYPGIIALLDEAIAKVSDAKANSNPLIGNADFYFAGNIDKWVAFAKSLKLKVLMRDFDANKSAIESLLNAGGLLKEDCAFTAFEDAVDKGNPLYEYNIRQLNTRENIRACSTMLEYLLANNDPRVNAFYEVTTYAAGRIAGGEQLTDREKFEGLPAGGKEAVPSDESAGGLPLIKHSRYKQAYNDPVYLMNKAESFFQVAEAWARLGDKAKAKLAYDDGVVAAFERYGYDTGNSGYPDATEYIKNGGVYAFKDGSLDEMMTCIMTQKWVSYAKANAWDSFFDVNRTGYPITDYDHYVRVDPVDQSKGLTPGYKLGTLVISMLSGIGNDFPRRMILPNLTQDYNANAPSAPLLTDKMWWQK